LATISYLGLSGGGGGGKCGMNRSAVSTTGWGKTLLTMGGKSFRETYIDVLFFKAAKAEG
jgi:hypothetical protein